MSSILQLFQKDGSSQLNNIKEGMTKIKSHSFFLYVAYAVTDAVFFTVNFFNKSLALAGGFLIADNSFACHFSVSFVFCPQAVKLDSGACFFIGVTFEYLIFSFKIDRFVDIFYVNSNTCTALVNEYTV